MNIEQSSDLLRDKVAIVTGSAHPEGIGRAIANALAGSGAIVVATDLAGAQGLEEVSGIPCDVTDMNAVQSMVDQTVEAFGGLDILFANAGGNTVWKTPTEEITPEQWQGCVDVNLTSAFYCSRAAIPHLKKA